MDKVRHVKLHPSRWLAEANFLPPNERGIYLTLCFRIIDKNGPIEIGDRLHWVLWCSKRALTRTLEHLQKLGMIRIAGGKVWHDYCLELVQESARKMARSGIGRDEILERDGYQCTYCGDAAGPFHVDHIVPVAKGGTSDLSNLTTACVRCNVSKGALTLEEWRRLSGEAGHA